MLIKSQVKRMHVLNNCVSNGFIYLLYMTRFVCTIWSQDCFIIFPVDLTYKTRTPETKNGMFPERPVVQKYKKLCESILLFVLHQEINGANLS